MINTIEDAQETQGTREYRAGCHLPRPRSSHFTLLWHLDSHGWSPELPQQSKSTPSSVGLAIVTKSSWKKSPLACAASFSSTD